MKNILALIFLVTTISISIAQVNPHAIGLRSGGGNFGFGGEFSYQHGLGEANRLELDLGWRGNNGNGNNYSHSSFSAIYHWVWNIQGGLNWFAGPGARIGAYRNKFDGKNDGLTLGVGGQIGIEYDFKSLDVPILFGLDTRPMWGFHGGNSGLGYGGAFSVRFIF